MKIKTIDRRDEQDILIGMIVDKNFLASVSTVYTRDCLRNPWARTVATWCLNYYRDYGDCPKKDIEKIYNTEQKKGKIKEDDEDLIEKFLDIISERYSTGEAFNCDYMLDHAEQYFQRIQIENLQENIEGLLIKGEVEEAKREILSMKDVRVSRKSFVDPLLNKELNDKAFEEASTPIMKLPGALGLLLEEQLTRGSFISFQAPEKAGKTWTLNWITLEALKQGLKVALFQVGDLTQTQETIRLKLAVCKKSNKAKYCGEFKQPVKWIKHDGGEKSCPFAPDGLDVEYKMVNIKSPLGKEEAYEKSKAFYEKHNISEGNFKMICASTKTINIAGINRKLDEEERLTGFVPDVVVIDYMDILSFEDGKSNTDDRIDDTWGAAKSLCNERNVLLIGATQADAQSYDGQAQGKNNFSRDKRKYAHVNGMVGMNQTDDEKKFGIMKYNWLVARDGDFNVKQVCYVLQCLRRGMPVVDSTFANESSVNYIEKRNDRQDKKEESKTKIPKNVASFRSKRRG